MTKIQIIIDDGKSLKGIACNNIIAELIEPDNPWEQPRFGSYQFIARDIMFDESPNLISIPDELLERIRDHNIDAEHQNAVEQTFALKEKIESLKGELAGWELRCRLAEEEWGRYHKLICEAIDKHPKVAMDIALEDGDIQLACYFAQKANEEEEENESKEN